MQANTSQQESLLDILKRRYALGEINLEQYQGMQRVLGLSDAPGAATAPAGHHQHGGQPVEGRRGCALGLTTMRQRGSGSKRGRDTENLAAQIEPQAGRLPDEPFTQPVPLE